MPEKRVLLDALIKKLEYLCPGCTFAVDARPSSQGLIYQNVIHIDEAGYGFTVNLSGTTTTVEEWFQDEIEKHPGPPPTDAQYKVNCLRCGSVTLGYIQYMRQMLCPNDFWFCPQCGSRAAFDDENYESYIEGGVE